MLSELLCTSYAGYVHLESFLFPPALVMSCDVFLCYVLGTCRCYKSNFGRPYCGMEPREYHGSQASMYRGDRHPKGDYPPDAYERMTRRCENCGEVKQLLRKDYLYPEAYQKSYGFSKITMGVVGLAVWWYLFK